ncbi:MAG: PEP-CTERM sorting domain-containing protein [Phycisphaerae bacterium]
MIPVRSKSAVGLALVGLSLLIGDDVRADAVVTFDNGTEGWIGPQGPGGSTTVDPQGGHPGANLHTIFSNFGITFHNSSNGAFVGDYTQSQTVALSIDVKVQDISFFGTPVSRPWLVDLRDFDNPEPGFPWTSVWFKFADISLAQHGDWTTFTVLIEDTSAVDLPPGWGGTGAETPQAEPILPPNRTFTDVLAGIDEIAFTTFEPGFVFGETQFDVRLDNIAITTGGPAVPVPAISTWGMIVLALLALTAGTVVFARGGSCVGMGQDVVSPLRLHGLGA